jgi:hypothetical protein
MPLPEDYVDGEVLSAADVNAITAAVNASDPSLFIAKTLIDAKGDLVVGTAADTAGRLAVGANGTALIADSTESSGLRWGSLSPWVLINSTASNSATVSLSVAGFNYRQLMFVFSATSLGGGFQGQIRCNGVSTSGSYTYCGVVDSNIHRQGASGSASFVLFQTSDTNNKQGAMIISRRNQPGTGGHSVHWSGRAGANIATNCGGALAFDGLITEVSFIGASSMDSSSTYALYGIEAS